MSGIPAGAGSLLGKRLGKYEILALLALGGTAEIYLARIGGAAGFEKYVVVKCLHDHLADDQDFVRMFLDEARLAAHLDHSNIVQTMELGEHGNRYYMVMEFLAGLSLAIVVRRAAERVPGGKIPVPLALNIVAQACAGLHYAHERTINGKPLNIVHRDISPQNLVVSFEGVVKVVDFGIAKAEMRETKTKSGTIKGKFAYMSPEQCVATNVDRRTDVFALGVIAYELVTGKRLFKRASPYETYQAVIECEVRPPSKVNHELDPALDDIIMKAITREREDRYASAEAFGDALLSYLHHRGKSSGPGDVARFFEASFAEEIDEHGARMRELISGRDATPADGPISWGEEEDDRRRNETIALNRKSDDDLLDSDSDSDRPSTNTLSEATSETGLRSRTDDLPYGMPDDATADATQIESNPLERVQELERASSTGLSDLSMPHPPAPPRRPGSARPALPPTGALPLPEPPPAPVRAAPAPAGPAPRLSRALPADSPTDLEGVQVPPELAETEIAGHLVDPAHAPRGGQPPAPRPSLPTDYPVMNKELSDQILRGADVFPDRPPRSDSGRMQASGPVAVPTHEAATLMSPVGPLYPQQVDWARAAAMPARAVPVWVMVLLFVGSIGAAMAVFFLIGRLIG